MEAKRMKEQYIHRNQLQAVVDKLQRVRNYCKYYEMHKVAKKIDQLIKELGWI